MILEVYLENIKSYRAQKIEFTRGLNGIIGENGAGKSTILEAIGFVLFNHLPYSISDFVRRGERRAEIRVRIESPSDGRIYRIVRRIDGGKTSEYFVEDVELGRIAEGVRDVRSWIMEHFRLEMDPEVIFENAVGVNQGNVTAHFLLPPGSRKAVFSPLLGIEKYDRAFEKSREYQNFLETRINEIQIEISRIEERLKMLERMEKEHSEKRNRIDELKRGKKEIEGRLGEVKERLDLLNRIREKISDLKNERELLESRKNMLDRRLKELLEEKAEIARAEKALSELKESYIRYQKLQKAMETVGERLDTLEKTVNSINEKKREHDLIGEKLLFLKHEISELRKEVEDYKELRVKAEKEKKVRDRIRTINEALAEKKTLEEFIRRIEKEIRTGEDEIKSAGSAKQELERLRKRLEKFRGVDEKRRRTIEVISRIEQKIGDLKALRRSVEEAACPILDEPCDRIADRKEKYDSEIAEMSEKLDELRDRLKMLEKMDKVRQDIEKRISSLATVAERLPLLETEIDEKVKKLEELKKRVEKIESLEKEKSRLEKDLQSVEGSEEKFAIVSRKLNDLKRYTAEYREMIAKLEKIRKELDGSDEIIQEYENLKSEKSRIEKEMHRLRPEYEMYVRLSEKTEKREDVEKKIIGLEGEIKETIRKISRIEKNLSELSAEYSERDHEKTEKLKEELSSMISSISGEMEAIKREITKLEREISQMIMDRERLTNLRNELKNLEKKLEFLRDLRDLFRKAVPELTRVYAGIISAEANRIFCEIMDDYSWQIELSEDFGIRAKYMGREIDFRQMSGGEQMVSALAVRLALLKFLSSIPVIFFDEPTQNMDVEKRRNFAQQISRIKDFRQIFVISHDDTFEEMVENAIRVRKENGVSVV